MISTSDLRTNNFVSSILHRGLITSIHTIGPNYIKLWANPFASYKQEDIEGIPVTPDIADKCGFKNIIDEAAEISWWEIKINQFEVTLADVTKDKGLVIIECGGQELLRCDYVHDLQNIVHALTKYELPINL